MATYQYDYMGRRTRKTVRQPDGSTTQSEFVYDGWNVIAEFETKTTKHKEQNTKNSAARYYTWGRDLSGTLQGAGGVGGLLSIRIESDDSKGELLYPSYDANGNISEVVDSNGMVRAAFQYGPFGNLISGSGDLAEEIPFRFSTKYFDDETGFNYYGFRYYVPETGRWLNRDPIGERGGLNLYAFVTNRPTISVDYMGQHILTDRCIDDYIDTLTTTDYLRIDLPDGGHLYRLEIYEVSSDSRDEALIIERMMASGTSFSISGNTTSSEIQNLQSHIAVRKKIVENALSNANPASGPAGIPDGGPGCLAVLIRKLNSRHFTRHRILLLGC